MIRLFLATGHAPMREALRSGLGAAAGFAMVGAANSREELLAQLSAARPDLLLLDLGLPGSDGFALLPALREQQPELRIMARGEATNEHYVARAFGLGAHGYILRTASQQELAYGLQAVALGRPFLCSAIGLALLGRLYAGSPAAGDAARPALGLSKREMEVLGLVAEGLTNAEIAAKLFTSKRTVETHRQNIIAKTQTRNTASLIKLATRQGLLPE